MCVFCAIAEADMVITTAAFFCILDRAPVNEGHLLIIPKQHHQDLFALTSEEWTDLQEAIHAAKKYLDSRYHPDGYNVGINCGEVAGQTVMHMHVHLIPRYAGDVEKPRGGIRNFKKPLFDLWD